MQNSTPKETAILFRESGIRGYESRKSPNTEYLYPKPANARYLSSVMTYSIESRLQ